MEEPYNKTYAQLNVFGKPYTQLINLFKTYPPGTLLDIGSGQGRNAIALAKLGFMVTALEKSAVGLLQTKEIANKELLKINYLNENCYTFKNFHSYKYILADNFFHCQKNTIAKETTLINSVVQNINVGTFIIVCIVFTKKKSSTLQNLMQGNRLILRHNIKFKFQFPFQEEFSTLAKTTAHLQTQPKRKIPIKANTASTIEILFWEKTATLKNTKIIK